MGKTRRRRRNRKKKNDTAAASSKDTIKTYDNSGVDIPWSDLNHDVLVLVMMRLGIVDFFAFNGVCKSWRSLAVSNKNRFILSRPPMSIHVSRKDKKEECYFKDFEGRKFKPIIPHYEGRRCIGVTSGYLILKSEKNKDLRLVNLMTRHELDFPKVPSRLFYCDVNVRSILVFSPLLSGWVLVVLNFCYFDIWFAVEGSQKWIEVSTPFSICDLHAFKGRIYGIHSDKGSDNESDHESDQLRLCEMRLYPEPEFVLLETEGIPKSDFRCPEFVCCGENLYVIDRVSSHPYKNMHEVDFGEMKLVSHETKGEEYAFFLGNDEHCSGALPIVIVDLSSQYGRHVTDKNEKESFFFATIWYFFHDCLNANLLHE